MPLERHSRPPTMLRLCPLFGSTPHYIILFSNVKAYGISPGNPGGPRQLDLGFFFVLFSGGFAYFGVPYELRRGLGVQLRIRGGCRACYREVRPLAVIGLINVYSTYSVLLFRDFLLTFFHYLHPCQYYMHKKYAI